MGLIEQLGGYENAKVRRQELTRMAADPRLLFVGDIIKDIGEIEIVLLEYRRQHNIFEVGDHYVMLKIWHDDLMIVKEGEIDQPWWNPKIIRHADPEEIKAMRRLR